MLKWLLVIGVIAVVYFVFIKKRPAVASKTKTQNKEVDDDTLVPCTTCGTFVSVKEAFIKEGNYYCSKTCMKEA